MKRLTALLLAALLLALTACSAGEDGGGYNMVQLSGPAQEYGAYFAHSGESSKIA